MSSLAGGNERKPDNNSTIEKENKENEDKKDMAQIILAVSMKGKMVIQDPRETRKNWLPALLESLFPGAQDRKNVLIKHALCCLLNQSPIKRQDRSTSFAHKSIIYQLEFIPDYLYLCQCKSGSPVPQQKDTWDVSFKKEFKTEPGKPSVSCNLNITFAEFKGDKLPKIRRSGVIVVDFFPGAIGELLKTGEATGGDPKQREEKKHNEDDKPPKKPDNNHDEDIA